MPVTPKNNRTHNILLSSLAAWAAYGASTVAVAAEGHDVAEMVMAGAETHAAEGGGGFPQLEVSTYPSQIFWLFVTFVILYTLMSKMALPRVGEVLQTRQQLQDRNLTRAGEMQEEAEKVKSTYEQSIAEAQDTAQTTLRDAEQRANESAAERSASFVEQAMKRVASAEQAIDKAKKDALGSLTDISADIAAEMANKIAGLSLTKAEAKKAVTTVMQKEA